MQRISVAAAVIVRGDEVLLARRPDHVHQGGKWEFPGGKLEAGETPADGLHRELLEELGIEVLSARPLIRIPHDYPDKSVLLDVWRVDGFAGEPQGREGQQIRWVPLPELPQYEFPAANLPILAAARLPDTYVISPDLKDLPSFLAELDATIRRGHRLIQLRVFDVQPDDWAALLARLQTWRDESGVAFLLNSASLRSCQGYDRLPAVFAGLHLTSIDLMALQQRPANCQWLAASCHSPGEIARAEALGVDFITLSPLYKTTSHPLAEPLGWPRFADWVAAARVPVFGLGGLKPQDILQLQGAGAQGVAGISGLWQAGR